MTEKISVEYNNEVYFATYYYRGFFKPCLKIEKDGKVIYKKKSYNTFVLSSYFCDEGVIFLIKMINEK